MVRISNAHLFTNIAPLYYESHLKYQEFAPRPGRSRQTILSLRRRASGAVIVRIDIQALSLCADELDRQREHRFDPLIVTMQSTRQLDKRTPGILERRAWARL